VLSQAVDLIRMNNTRRCSERRYDPWNDVFIRQKTREIVRVSTDAEGSGHASSSVAAAISTPRLVSLSFFPMLLERS